MSIEKPLSKFDRSAVMNLKGNSYFLVFIPLGFLSRKYWSLLNYHQMADIWEKTILILAENLNSGLSHLFAMRCTNEHWTLAKKIEVKNPDG